MPLAREYPKDCTYKAENGYAFEKDYLQEFIVKGYKIDLRTINGKEYIFLQKFENGKLIEELPYLEREIDLYITGTYRIRNGRSKGQTLVLRVRIPIKVSYAPKKEYLDSIRADIEEEAADKFTEWKNSQGFEQDFVVDVEMRERA
jgi:hypothetical protein